MYCKHCGQKIDEDSSFCSACGKPIGNTPSVVKTTKSGKRRVSAAVLRRPLSILYILLSVVCASPLVYAEYRRLILGVPLDLTYWLLIAPMFLSVFFLYLVLGAPVIAEEKKKREEADNA